MFDMRYRSRNKLQAPVRALIDGIDRGELSDAQLGELRAALGRSGEPAQAGLALEAISDIAVCSENLHAIACSLKALELFLPLAPETEETLDRWAQVLIKDGKARKSPKLAEAIARFVYVRSRERPAVARPFIPALIAFLELNLDTTGAYSYYTLAIVGRDAPDHFQPYIGLLLDRLESDNSAAQAFAAKIIAVLARFRPELVMDARQDLEKLSDNAAANTVKNAAREALQALQGKPEPAGHAARLDLPEARRIEPLKPIIAMSNDAPKPKPSWFGQLGKGLLARNGEEKRPMPAARPAQGSESDEMSRIMDDFSEIASMIEGGGSGSQSIAEAFRAARVPAAPGTPEPARTATGPEEAPAMTSQVEEPAPEGPVVTAEPMIRALAPGPQPIPEGSEEKEVAPPAMPVALPKPTVNADRIVPRPMPVPATVPAPRGPEKQEMPAAEPPAAPESAKRAPLLPTKLSVKIKGATGNMGSGTVKASKPLIRPLTRPVNKNQANDAE